ncbi:hypothetical protein [Rhodospirillum rubrum]|uniref:hypothetical protein n=1 Tax=Rhodospirillum rubrum TaxID=1085 RepID=UPI000229D615|nr:hypothetical protein [Rhodospirillum rubrum]AEO47255.1 hypothetical protein F11_03925 [Rhodospirillum rubrum F11]MBK5953189.1 hypothetical protein [Rhodospirillum rubrum]QXG81239.1 hypothetical protein KUL73_03975 [Rhodospirillum rubrum]HCF17828.1 hypothetical protein [Rhodospirillum rubrum]
MSFEALIQSADRLKATLHASTGRHLLADVSLDAPGDSQGEAAFIRSVLWCYVLWFEAFQPAGRYLMNIVRNSSPEDQKAASRAFQDVQNLRTFHTHNLLPSSKSDQHKLNQAKAWLAQNGGTESDWDRCTLKLCSGLTAALDILHVHWNRVTASPEDAFTAIQMLIDALEREWEPHLFDHTIEEAAMSLGLSGFDVVKYRGTRLEDWRGITGLFLDRKSAENAVRRVIYQEMAIKFGPAQN